VLGYNMTLYFLNGKLADLLDPCLFSFVNNMKIRRLHLLAFLRSLFCIPVL